MSNLFTGKTLVETRRQERDKRIELYYSIDGLKLANNGTHINLSVYYDLGGVNYFSGDTNERGIYVGVKVIKVENGVHSFILTNGYRKLLKPLNRFAKKYLDEDMVNEAIVFMTEILDARPSMFFVLEEVA